MYVCMYDRIKIQHTFVFVCYELNLNRYTFYYFEMFMINDRLLALFVKNIILLLRIGKKM